jgi:hypothetical protein
MLFVLFTGLYAARWIFFFEGARPIFWHPVLSMFLGAIGAAVDPAALKSRRS